MLQINPNMPLDQLAWRMAPTGDQFPAQQEVLAMRQLLNRTVETHGFRAVEEVQPAIWSILVAKARQAH